MESLLEVTAGKVRPELLLVPAGMLLPELSEIDEPPEPPLKRAAVAVPCDEETAPLQLPYSGEQPRGRLRRR
jgi:hypothetical protein